MVNDKEILLILKAMILWAVIASALFAIFNTSKPKQNISKEIYMENKP